jgi:hypothetical protein
MDVDPWSRCAARRPLRRILFTATSIHQAVHKSDSIIPLGLEQTFDVSAYTLEPVPQLELNPHR